MSVIGSNILAGASGQGGYFLTNSLRFRSSASAYLNRTPASAGNRKTWTWSAWVKRGDLTNFNMLFSAFSSGAGDAIGFRSSGTALYPNSLYFYLNDLTDAGVFTNAVFRDPSAWYHIVLAVDTTQATSSNRIKLYINGTQQTFVSATYPTQNYDCKINNNVAHQIGAVNGASYLDGYLGEVNFIDGSALTPSSFGETSTSTGVWIPKKYSGTYGTNGFYLPFTDNSALTTSSNVGLGKDFSGNSNYWTTNNISITSGSTYDSMTDVPTLTSATAANYCVMNPLDKNTSATISNGNLTQDASASAWRAVRSTYFVSSGKWYWEATISGSGSDIGMIGIANASASLSAIPDANAYGYNGSNGQKYTNSTNSSYGATFASGDVIGIALDMDAGTLTFYKNNTSQGTAFSSLSGSFSPTFWQYAGYTWNANFGQRPFAYTPPSGFNRLNTFNLPTPTIGATAATTANKYFNPVIWTGTGGTRSITGVGFQPDFVWAKARSQAYSNIVFDSNRGVGKSLLTDTTGAEATNEANGYISSFDTDGFSSNFSAAANYYFNENGTTYVGWNWRANQGTNVSNTAGSITSTVSANTTAGFSIVTYTGTGSAATIGHGLGVVPNMVIFKSRNNAGGTQPWATYHSSLNGGVNPANYVIYLNYTLAEGADSTQFNNTAPTSSVFSIGTAGGVNVNTGTYVAYCFAQVAGYSAFGSYTGNGSTDGPFIFTGFRPRFFMTKCTSSTGDWHMTDTARYPTNSSTSMGYLDANTSAAEGNFNIYDGLSNGFKIRDNGSVVNGSGATYIYMAFCESPFKFSNAR